MSLPTNGAMSLAYSPSMMLGAGALTNLPLLSFDGFTDEGFLVEDDAALLGGVEVGTDQTLPPLLPFDGFTDEDFLIADDGALLCGVGVGTDQTLVLPSCPGANGCGGSSSYAQGPGALACEVTTAVAAGSSFSLAGQPAPGQVSWEATTAVAADCNTFSRARQPSPSPPPSPALPLGQTTSNYRGVTRDKLTGRYKPYKARLYDKKCGMEGHKRKRCQVYLGIYGKEDKAARAHDIAALKYWGDDATTNFPRENYIREIQDMQSMNRRDVVASLRRKSSGFSRGASIYRGVSKQDQHGRWQAKIIILGKKNLHLGTFATEQEAAEAYDIAALKFRGKKAATNFEPSRYNLLAIAQRDIPILGKKLIQKPAPEAEDQAALSAP